MYKVLIVGEKWDSCNPEFGLSALHHNFIGSLNSTGLAEIQSFFFDEHVHQSQSLCDEALLNFCYQERPDFVILKLVRGTDLNPKFETLSKIRQNSGAKLISIHGDTHDKFSADWMLGLSRIANLIVVQDCYSVYPKYISDTSLFLDLWTPQDPTIFYKAKEDIRTIDVSFIGRVDRYPERKLFLGNLEHNGIDVIHKGGTTEHHFPIRDYANHLRQSKISINFSRPVFDEPNHHCKGRTLETTLCGALLLEQKNPETKKWFKPGVDYVEFTEERDLVQKVYYYLTNDKERREIAAHGNTTAANKYSAKNYWKTLFQKLSKTNE